MFTDDNFSCITTLRIRDEFRTTSKFKEKYPWRRQLAGNIRTIPAFHEKKAEAEAYEKAIKSLVDDGVENTRTSRLFDLSEEDTELLAWALILESQIISGDVDINDFGNQQFHGEFRGTIFPLKAINNWLELNLIQWNETLQAYLEDWNKNNERPQPEEQKIRFGELTGYPYVGS